MRKRKIELETIVPEEHTPEWAMSKADELMEELRDLAQDYHMTFVGAVSIWDNLNREELRRDYITGAPTSVLGLGICLNDSIQTYVDDLDPLKVKEFDDEEEPGGDDDDGEVHSESG